MKPRDPHLEQLFVVSLSLAAAACGATTTPSTDGPGPDPVGSTSASAAASVSRPGKPHHVPHDDSTPEGYARGYQSVSNFGAALSGLELQGFADAVDGKLVCEGERPCPAAWDTLMDGTFSRAAFVKKRSNLAVITPQNFFQWVGPVDGPERAALRARVEPWRKTTTCAKLAELGYACAPGSAPDGIPVRAVDGGFEVATFDERNVCTEHGGYFTATSLGAVIVDPEGNLTEAATVLTAATDAKARANIECMMPVPGRRSAASGAEASCDDDPASITAYLERAMRHEAQAAIAFDELADELAMHGAHAELVAEARASAGDERRHAAIFARLLRRAAPSGARADAPRRSLVELLVENANEGCANETYAAVVATHQASHAPDARLRSALGRIARDEQRHADLSFRIHAWGRSVLDAAAARELDRALASAVDAFAERGASSPVGRALGEPAPAVARDAFRRVARDLASRHAPA